MHARNYTIDELMNAAMSRDADTASHQLALYVQALEAKLEAAEKAQEAILDEASDISIALEAGLIDAESDYIAGREHKAATDLLEVVREQIKAVDGLDGNAMEYDPALVQQELVR